MPEPLFPDELYDDFCRTVEIEDHDQKMNEIFSLLHQIRDRKPLNYNTI